jgi:hypothetical protein
MGPALSSEEVYEALVCEDSLANLLERIAETVGGRSSLMISANKDGPPETRSSHLFWRKLYCRLHIPLGSTRSLAD